MAGPNDDVLIIVSGKIRLFLVINYQIISYISKIFSKLKKEKTSCEKNIFVRCFLCIVNSVYLWIILYTINDKIVFLKLSI